MAHIGMLKVLEEYRLLDDIVIVAGTSAGSLMGALFGLGYTPDAMRQIWMRDAWRLFGGKVSAQAVMDWNVRGALDALIHFDLKRFQGFIKGDKLLRALEVYLVSNPQNTGVRPTRRPCPLYVIATNFITNEQTVWCYTRHAAAVPGVITGAERGLEPALGREAHWRVHYDADPAVARFPSMAQTCRCSSSVPFIFVPGRAPIQYQGAPVDDSIYTDGGVRDNYSLSAAVKLARCDRVFGMFLGSYGPSDQPWNGLFDMANRTVDQMGRTIFEADQDDAEIMATDIRTLVPRFPGSYSTFDVTAMQAIYDAGRAVTKEFLQRVERTAGTVTWDTIFATRDLAPLDGAATGTMHAARLPPTMPGAPTPPEVRYYIYEKEMGGR
jgi:predicted acylesterase/phospholipase RssA